MKEQRMKESLFPARNDTVRVDSYVPDRRHVRFAVHTTKPYIPKGNAAMKYKEFTRHHHIVCRRCSSKNLSKFNAEINIHFPGHEGLTKPTVRVFPQVTLCMDCGCADFFIPETELQRLADDDGRLVHKAA